MNRGIIPLIFVITVLICGVPRSGYAQQVATFPQNQYTLSVQENTPTGTAIGNPVTATLVNPLPEGIEGADYLRYTLSGTDANSFSIDSRSGQLKTQASLDYETKNTYSVTVTATAILEDLNGNAN